MVVRRGFSISWYIGYLPMHKCTQCSKSASLHITEILDGNVQEIHLCESCAQNYLATPEPKSVISDEEADGFLEKIAEFSSDDDLDDAESPTCPNCGISFKEFRSQGRLGCPHDYIAFEQELLPLLENIHSETQHTGKYPQRTPAASQKQYELIKLRNQLRAAVDEEAYELAADLRDTIRDIEEKPVEDE